MKRLIFKMNALAQNGDQSGLIALAQQASADYGACWRLAGRIAYRMAWALRPQPKINENDRRSVAWELEYDELHNFAHMGAEHVDADWGKPKTKPKVPSERKTTLAQLNDMYRSQTSPKRDRSKRSSVAPGAPLAQTKGF